MKENKEAEDTLKQNLNSGVVIFFLRHINSKVSLMTRMNGRSKEMWSVTCSGEKCHLPCMMNKV